ncbi:MAG: ABC transporter permease subunit [Chloroflexi bacterium]|nr:ABC transporter permease subunit [Chloroflexota bacterium]
MADSGSSFAARLRVPAFLQRFSIPMWVLVLPLLFWAVAFFLVPIFFLVRESFFTFFATEAGVHGTRSDLTLGAWENHVFTRQFFDIWWFTLKLATIQTVIVLLVVFPYAYAVAFHGGSRRMQFGIMALTMMPFFVSYLLQVYSWQPVLAQRGIFHQVSQDLSNFTYGITPVIPAFSRTAQAVHISMLAYLWPITALLMYVLGLNTIDRRLLEAASNLGASAWGVFFDVVVRLSKPGIVMAGMLTFVLTFSDLLSARLLGSVRTIATVVADQQNQAGNTPAAAAVSVAMLLTVLIVILVSFRIMGRVSLTGTAQGAATTFESSGITAWFWRALIVAGLFFVTIPVMSLILYGFHDGGIPVWPIAEFSTKWYDRLFHDEGMLTSIQNSVKVSLAVGTIGTIMGGLAAYYLARFRPGWVLPYTMIVVAPAVTPPLVLSLGLLVYFVELGIWGGLNSVVIAHVGLVGVFCLFILNNRLSQMDPHLEEAATNLGASRPRAIFDTTFQLAIPAIIASFVVAAGISFGESVVTFFLTAVVYTWPAFSLNTQIMNSSPEIYAAGALVYGSLIGIFALAAIVSFLPGYKLLGLASRLFRRLPIG